MSLEAALLERLGIAGHPRTQGVVLAVAAAFKAYSEPRSEQFSPFETGLEAILHLPKKAGQFERGIAAGIAMMLSTEAKASSSSIPSVSDQPAQERAVKPLAALMLATETQPMKAHSYVIDPR